MHNIADTIGALQDVGIAVFMTALVTRIMVFIALPRRELENLADYFVHIAWEIWL